MNTLRLDLEALEVERLDMTVCGLGLDLEQFGMGHGSTELSQSCKGGYNSQCDLDLCGASCRDCVVDDDENECGGY